MIVQSSRLLELEQHRFKVVDSFYKQISTIFKVPVEICEQMLSLLTCSHSDTAKKEFHSVF